MTRTRLGVAVLTMGNRPTELAALLASVAAQDAPPERTVVVANGAPLPTLPPESPGSNSRRTSACPADATLPSRTCAPRATST